jgi:aldose 1-epimerase
MVTVWTYGASLIEVRLPGASGRSPNLVSRLRHLREYEDGPAHSYPGATIGRYARCVSAASFPLAGRVVRLSANSGPHHVHGGHIGFDRFVWTAEIVRRESAVGIQLQLERPDGDQGYPGAVTARTTYLVHHNSRLRVEHWARTSAPTIVAMTTHAFWNLAGESRIDDHLLEVEASRYLPVDGDLIPRAPARTVAGTPFDYREQRRLGAARLDHSFLFDGSPGRARLRHPPSGRVLTVTTNQPGLQVYSGDALARPYRRAGLCLQTGALPDSPNRPDLPSSRLDPGQEYLNWTEYAFGCGAARLSVAGGER